MFDSATTFYFVLKIINTLKYRLRPATGDRQRLWSTNGVLGIFGDAACWDIHFLTFFGGSSRHDRLHEIADQQRTLLFFDIESSQKSSSSIVLKESLAGRSERICCASSRSTKRWSGLLPDIQLITSNPVADFLSFFWWKASDFWTYATTRLPKNNLQYYST